MQAKKLFSLQGQAYGLLYSEVLSEAFQASTEGEEEGVASEDLHWIHFEMV
jgi:hypothetical protein